jgi:exopolysaccharide biosynthesis protein
MRKFLQQPYRWAIIFSAVMMLFATFVLLDTFVIARAGVPEATAGMTTAASTTAAKAAPTAEPVKTADTSAETQAATAETTGTVPVVTSNSYRDANIQINMETVFKYETYFYVADVQITNIGYLKAAFAQNTYGRNIKETTSTMAENNKAIFAVNGDYYGFRNYGFVLRNGILYRSTARKSGNDEALLVDQLGDFSIINERNADAQTFADAGAWQIFSFGPALIDHSEITVTARSEVSQSMTSNPRTAMGQVSALHYIFIVSDGRTDESAGLALLNLAQEFLSRGCSVAYNLDGGGSATMWFNGQIVNNPTDGRTENERKISDVVYIGYS